MSLDAPMQTIFSAGYLTTCDYAALQQGEQFRVLTSPFTTEKIFAENTKAEPFHYGIVVKIAWRA